MNFFGWGNRKTHDPLNYIELKFPVIYLQGKRKASTYMPTRNSGTNITAK